MKIIILGIVFFIAGLSLAHVRSIPAIRYVGCLITLAYMLGLAGLTLVCFYLAFAGSSSTNAMMMIFPGLICAVLTYICWSIGGSTIIRSGMSDRQQFDLMKKDLENMEENSYAQLEKDEERLKRGWLMPSARKKLKRRIADNSFIIQTSEKMTKQVEEHLLKKEKEELGASQNAPPKD